MIIRNYSLWDRICLSVDQAVRALNHTSHATGIANPAKNMQEDDLTEAQRQNSAALMRVNHTGEICAQALYHGQAMVAKTKTVREQMLNAALEEGDHLNWCYQRIHDLGSHTSYLNPFWYAGSFCIGMLAGMVGEKWNLGFVAETEYQVGKHLEKHLKLLSIADKRSHAILKQMYLDEDKHRRAAIYAGAKELPSFVKSVMGFTSQIMVKTSYWV